MEDLGLDPTSTLAEVIARVPGAERLLESMALDYCCGGQRTLAEACATAGIEPTAVLDRLGEVEPQPAPAWASMGPGPLVDHVESTHHAYLHAEMPRLSELAAKVAAVHGDRHPELHEVRRTYEEARADLEPHLQKEEQVLFPMIRQLVDAHEPPRFHCGSLRNPVSTMRREHDVTGEQLARLRELTGGFEPPADGCASYRALYAGLAQLEADTVAHVHKENNLLFPAVLDLERTIGGAVVSLEG